MDENEAVFKRILGLTLRNHVSRRVRPSVFLWLLDTLLACGILYCQPRTSSGRYRTSIRNKNTHLIMRQYLLCSLVVLVSTSKPQSMSSELLLVSDLRYDFGKLIDILAAPNPPSLHIFFRISPPWASLPEYSSKTNV